MDHNPDITLSVEDVSKNRPAGPAAPYAGALDDSIDSQPASDLGDWRMTVEEFSFSGCHYNSSCD